MFLPIDSLSPKLEYRYSSLKLFRQCPAQFKLKYIDHEPEYCQGIEAFTGSCFHSAAEDLHNALINKRLMSLNEFQERYVHHWESGYDEFFIRNVMGKPTEYYFDIGYNSCENYYLTNYPFTHEQDIACELELQIDVGGYALNMHIDRVAQSGDITYIHDYKTASAKPTKSELSQSMQLAIYEMGIREYLPDVKDVVLVWHYVRHDKRYESTRNENSLAKVKEEILTIIQDVEEAIEFNHFPYRPNFKCDWCPYSSQCKSYEEMKGMKE